MKNQEPTKLSRRDEAISFYSDFHKDARGFRPRGFAHLSTEAIEQLGEDMAAEVKQQLADEAEDNDPNAWKKYV